MAQYTWNNIIDIDNNHKLTNGTTVCFYSKAGDGSIVVKETGIIEELETPIYPGTTYKYRAKLGNQYHIFDEKGNNILDLNNTDTESKRDIKILVVTNTPIKPTGSRGDSGNYNTAIDITTLSPIDEFAKHIAGCIVNQLSWVTIDSSLAEQIADKAYIVAQAMMVKAAYFHDKTKPTTDE